MEDLFYMFFAVLFTYGTIVRIIEWVKFLKKLIKHELEPEDFDDIVLH